MRRDRVKRIGIVAAWLALVGVVLWAMLREEVGTQRLERAPRATNPGPARADRLLQPSGSWPSGCAPTPS